MSRSLNDLNPIFRPLADHFLAKIREAGIVVTIICTLRSQLEQDANVANGVSKVKKSKHQEGLAIDICPSALLHEKGWAPASPIWWELGEIGKSIGLRWGGQWSRPAPPPVGKVPKYFWDPGHFEYVAPKVKSPVEEKLIS